MSLLRKILGTFSLVLVLHMGHTQVSDGTIRLLQILDSVSNSSSVSCHFAKVYLETTIGSVNFFCGKDEEIQCLMERMEIRFAEYFFRSVEAYQNKLAVADEWKAYYSDTSASTIKCVLYGINAHINGDIWQALTTEFTLEEIKKLKPYYLSYYKELLKIYKGVYAEAIRDHPAVRLLHSMSFGFDKLYGKYLLLRWRKRQLKMAEWYYTDRDRFDSNLKKLRRKMNSLNELITRHL